ncbi:uncharacterized protein F4822DRAFT_53807 [Hypoxylon trugodes]|uniref:uncharacterized protein n=1 Tax=Hypoxylon trugodes TaxID=326681 RepID=UPI00219B73B2|nr:uncharacterized protein F4822DRAFT_53807 [Hypoxylon trugodes]KAI1383869.1 hypothetical protein F4822DRAFT_53807 [Hypoxylon trugodes]
MKTDQSNTTSITQSLDALRHDISINHKSHDRNIASTSQSLVQMAGDLSALRQDTTSSSSQIQALLLEHRDEIRREFQAKNNNLAELVCAQVIAYPTKLLQDILDKLSAPMVLTIQQAHEGKDHSTNSQDSALEFDLQRGTARLELSNRAAQPRLGLDDLVKPHKYPNPLRCSCRSKRSTTRWDYKQFWFRIENNAVQGCSIHGRKQERAYSIEAKLSPFLKRTLVFTLGYLKEKNSPEMALSLKLKSVVERAKSPIFSLFDSFFDERTVNVPKGQTSACRQREIGLLEEDGLGGRVLTWVNRIWRGFR